MAQPRIVARMLIIEMGVEVDSAAVIEADLADVEEEGLAVIVEDSVTAGEVIEVDLVVETAEVVTGVVTGAGSEAVIEVVDSGTIVEAEEIGMVDSAVGIVEAVVDGNYEILFPETGYA